mmetsp:Transcript_24692/g.58393  ORF Transcript_24692/g.58393 Transcript_24692/m.58393 type:complete len:434 (+) Transcript_24692:565-1866(+)
MSMDDSAQQQASSFTQNLHRNKSDDDGRDAAREICDDEKNHFDSVCSTYRQYATFSMSQWAQRDFRSKALPESQRKFLPAGLRTGTPEHAKRSEDYKNALIRNQFCLDCILQHAGQPHSQQQPSNNYVTDDQISKVSSVLKSLSRDWSDDGKVERDMAYRPIKDLIHKYLPLEPHSSANRSPPRIVVPGSGVGRLAFDLASMGYSVQGNEFSMYMLLASDFILNNGGSICNPERPLHISPWLQESRNVHASTDPLRTVKIPDVDPVAVLLPPVEDNGPVDPRPMPEFSMAAGDFVSIYNQDQEAGRWDCVASCFFLDATPNVVETLRVVYNMLKPGGLLVNLGPLLYHWSGPPTRPTDKTVDDYRRRYSHLDDRYFTSIDLCYDDLKVVLNAIGFEVLEEETGVECYYTADKRSMMKTKYQCVCFVAKKKQQG